jgi:hypothetical protein
MAEPFRRHSPVAQAAYHDLVSLLLDESVSDIRGKPTPRQRDGRTYWYDRYRIGTETKEHYLGEDTAALRSRIERYEALAQSRESRRRERARLVRLLRSERFLGMDGGTGSLLGAMARSGVFRLGGSLVGTHAFRCYEGELGLKLSFDQTAVTQDVDIASFEKLSLSLSLEEKVSPSLESVFHDLSFEAVPTIEVGRDRNKVWRWRQGSGEALVEFLTPSFQAAEDVRELKALGVAAQSLHYLNYLIAEPIQAAAVYRDGVLIQLPRPERYAIHKLIVADRRRDGPDSAKSRKDLAQASLLIGLLSEDRPMDLKDAYDDAMSRGPKWRERLERSLDRSPEAARLITKAIK